MLTARGKLGPVLIGGGGLLFLAGRIVPCLRSVSQNRSGFLFLHRQLGPVFVARRGLLFFARNIVP